MTDDRNTVRESVVVENTVEIISGSLPATKIYSGNTDPASTVARTGDFYINTSSAHLFGPKTSNSSWGAGLSLRGPAGMPGTGGGIILVESCIWTGTLGVDFNVHSLNQTTDDYVNGLPSAGFTRTTGPLSVESDSNNTGGRRIPHTVNGLLTVTMDWALQQNGTLVFDVEKSSGNIDVADETYSFPTGYRFAFQRGFLGPLGSPFAYYSLSVDVVIDDSWGDWIGFCPSFQSFGIDPVVLIDARSDVLFTPFP